MADYVAQLLPTEEQSVVLNKALREFADKYADEPDAEIADELRLELLKQKRRRNG